MVRLGALLLGSLAVSAPYMLRAQALVPAGETSSVLKPVEVDAEGTGPSRDAAISKALANALAQETGVDISQVNVAGTLQGNAAADIASTETSNVGPAGHPAPNTVKQDDKSGHASLDAQVSVNAVASGSGGHVVRYSVLNVAAEPAGGFTARVHAVLAIYRRQAGAADNRKRIAVADFTVDAATGLAQALRDQLVVDLVQSHRFTVVDRAHDDAYQNEIDAIQSGNAAPEERSRAGQMLGADYVLVGKLHVTGARTTGSASRSESHTLELTGEVVTNRTASTLHTIPGSAAAEFELIDVATREIKQADRATVTGAGVDALAQHITDDLLTTIYPPRLVKADDPEALMINQGGEGMRTGQRFRLMAEGQELFDPYTHESLGRTEQLLGIVEVTEVGARMSTARLVTGGLPAPGLSTVLRPEKVAAEPKIAAVHRHGVLRRAAAISPAAPDTGLKLPFDR